MDQPKVLIVDDDENNHSVLCDALGGEPYRLLEAVDGPRPRPWVHGARHGTRCLLLFLLSVSTLRAEDWVQINREAARAWAMQAVAVIQAGAGEDAAAKRTALQIGKNDVVASDVVAVYCMNGQIFYDHPPGYCPAPPILSSYTSGCVGQDSRGNPYSLNRVGAGDPVPAKELLKNNSVIGPPLPSPPAPLRDIRAAGRGEGSNLPSNPAPQSKGEGSSSRTGPKCPPDLRPDYLDPDPQHGAVVEFFEDYDSHGTRLTSRKYADGCVVIESLRPAHK